MGETVAAIVEAHRSGAASPEATIARAYARIRAHDDPAIFIALRAEADALAEAKALAAERTEDRPLADRPLFGVPVAVKDNIDVAGLPTTAACPAFAYTPKADATCVARLKRAGAIIIGKTNLDQFATGLVGVRTPYGIPRNLFDPALIPGGSSSGSAIAVGAGLVPLAQQLRLLLRPGVEIGVIKLVRRRLGSNFAHMSTMLTTMLSTMRSFTDQSIAMTTFRQRRLPDR